MDQEQLMGFLSEMLEEQKIMNKANLRAAEATQKLKLRMEEITEILKNQKTTLPQINITPFQEVVNNGFKEITAWIQVVLEKKKSNNLKIFLESDAKKWAVLLLVALTFLTYGYLLAIRR